jgi:hypothetical protein
MSEDKSEKWVMPEPIFRQSTGELVKPAAPTEIDPEPDTLQPNADVELVGAAPEDPLARIYSPPENAFDTPDVPPPAASIAAGIDVEPQPFLSEELTSEKIAVETTREKPKGSVSPILFAVGIVILLGAVIGILLIAYFLYTAGRS